MTFTRRQSLAILGAGICAATDRNLIGDWQHVADETNGTLGAAALYLPPSISGDQVAGDVSLHGSERFPLASVCKLPIAIHILALVDEGKLALDRSIEIPLYDVVPGVSPVAERWPKQKSFPLDELLSLMVAQSDNTAVQTLFRIGGGQAALAARFRQWKITGIRIDRSERQCNLEAAGVAAIPPVETWTPSMEEQLTAKISPAEHTAAFHRFLADPRDTATPQATVQLLRKVFAAELLSKRLTARLVEILQSTTTGSARLKGLLPPGTVVAHKTGTTGTVGGLNGATNDVGMITLPGNRGNIAIAVYLKASTLDDAARDKAIARIARAAFDFWTR